MFSFKQSSSLQAIGELTTSTIYHVDIMFNYKIQLTLINIDLSRIPLQCVRTIEPEESRVDIFIHLLYFCPPEPRLGAIVRWNAGKVYSPFKSNRREARWPPG